MLTVNFDKMLLAFSILILRLNLVVSDLQYLNSDEPELICANVLYRHGERNIGHGYATDPWASESHWPGGFMQLTNRGKQQQFELGQYLRKRFQSLIDKSQGKTLREIIYVRSTDTDRTIMSAAANLAGMFPPEGNEIWNSNLPWQPIPVHSASTIQDHNLPFPNPCSRLEYEYERYRNISDEKSLMKKHEALLRYIELHSGVAMNNLINVWNLFDILTIEQARGFELPEWTNYVFARRSDMEYLTAAAIKHGSETPEISRLRIGFLLREMFQHFKMKINSNLLLDRSIWMYSAHDTTISIFLNALGLIEPQVPPFCATVLMELYKMKNIYYIQLFYKNSTEDPMPLFIPSCGLMCPMRKFREIYDRIIPIGNFDEECHMEDETSGFEMDVDDENRALLTTLGIVISVSVLLAAVISLRIRHQRVIRDPKMNGYSTIVNTFKC